MQSLKFAWQEVKQKKDLQSGFLLLWAALIFIFFSIPASKINSYLLPVFPALALLLGQYFAKVAPEKLWPKLQLSVCYGLSALILIAAILLPLVPNKLFAHYHFSVAHQILAVPLVALLGIVCFFLFHYLKENQRLIGLIIFTALVLIYISLLEASVYFKPSVKPLWRTLATQIPANAVLATYHTYYQDLPFYAERDVLVVADWNDPKVRHKDNWSGQLSSLMEYQADAKNHLITDAVFWQKWQSAQPLYVFLATKDLADFEAAAGTQKGCVVATFAPIAVVVNQTASCPASAG